MAEATTEMLFDRGTYWRNVIDRSSCDQPLKTHLRTRRTSALSLSLALLWKYSLLLIVGKKHGNQIRHFVIFTISSSLQASLLSSEY